MRGVLGINLSTIGMEEPAGTYITKICKVEYYVLSSKLNNGHLRKGYLHNMYRSTGNIHKVEMTFPSYQEARKYLQGYAERGGVWAFRCRNISIVKVTITEEAVNEHV